MITLRKSTDRGRANHGWLDSYHSFSFADYHDPKFMGFRSLRVINEDRVAPSQGFGAHLHRDVEIVTYCIEGALKHHDSLGHEGIIESGQVQKITAGEGITHSEYNASNKHEVHFLQIWITPKEKGLTPGYQQHSLPVDQEDCLWPLPILIHQDAKLFRGRLCEGKSLDYQIAQGRGLWLQMVVGELEFENIYLNAGDGVAVEGQERISLKASHTAEFLLFDLN